ncbi:MAG: TetR/AcrR family transcriptional regulator [Clostridia bacterium]|nr:TetR/AcrR family transcriptional regulator [Clostridia bacterium]
MSNKELSNNGLNRNERRKLKTKENLRNAAIETFLEVGYLNTTVQDIMERADLGYGTFYQYYKSKQDVIVELANEAREIIKKEYVLLPETETSLYKRTIYRLEMVFKTYAKHREVLKILLECHHADEGLHRAWNQLIEAPFKAMKKDLTWSMNQGLCQDVNLNTAIIALHGMVQAVGVHIVQNNLTEQEIDNITKDIALLFTKAIYIKDIAPEFWRKNLNNR